MIRHIKFILLILFSSPLLMAQGIEFHHGTWNEALEKAQKEDKIIFMDGYATWCGPCKRLAKNVFPLANVGQYFNENFINVKMDMEKGEGPELRSKYRVSAFPTLLFIAPNGEVIQTTKGAPRDGKSLIALATKAAKNYDPSTVFMKKYESGDRSYETIYNLVKSLNRAKKPSLKYANEYIRSQENMGEEKNIKFLFEAMTQVDSRNYTLFMKYKSEIEAQFDKDEIHQKIKTAAQSTVGNAVEFESSDLLIEAQDKYGSNYPNQAKTFIAESNLTYAAATSDATLFIKNAKNANLEGRAKKNSINQALNNFEDDPKLLKLAEKWAKEMADEERDAESYYLLAMTQVKQQKVPQAIKSLRLCIDKTDPNAKEINLYREQIEKLESK